MGKTRLGLQVAAELAEHFIDGVFFVNLAPVSDPALVVPAVAQTLGILESASQSLLERLREQLQQRRVLLLLDNFEQVVSAAVQMADLLTACPKLKLLVTSREVLHVRAEYEFVVPPLALPDPSSLSEQEAFSHFASVTLFLQRVRTVKPDFQLTAANAHAIAEICVRLDGVPLAIELAAARMKLFTPQELLARLSHGLQILTSGARDAPLRHQTLRNTIAWSYDLLKAEEQQLFWRLSVFVGGCTLEAVETICAERDDGVRSALDGVTSLIDKSLVQHMEQEGYDSRLVMLETIREYGRERLTASEEEERIRRAHANYYLALVEEAEPHLKGAQQLLWLRRLDRAQENLRTALSWLIAHEEGEQTLRFCVALWWFWQTRGYWSEGRRWLKAALALPSAGERTLLRARALSAAGELAGAQTDWQEANQLLSESMTLFKEVGDDGGFVLPLSTMGWILVRQGEYAAAAPIIEECIIRCRKLGRTWELCRVLLWLGNLTYLQGDLAQATALYQEGLALARELGDRTLIYRGLNNMGYAFYLQGDLAQATALTQEGLALARELGDKLFILQTLETLGSIALSQGDLEQAITCYTEGYSLSRELGNELLVAWYLVGLARVAVAQHQLKRAARLFAAAEVRYDLNKQMSPDQRDDHIQTVGSVRARLGEQAFAAVWAEGRKMTLEQILAASDELESPERVTLASSSPNIDQHPPIPSDANDLTPRELEVLRLVAQGLTDTQIAEKLVISRRTVNAHLTSIYRKINVSSRSAATRYAIDRKLV